MWRGGKPRSLPGWWGSPSPNSLKALSSAKRECRSTRGAGDSKNLDSLCELEFLCAYPWSADKLTGHVVTRNESARE